MPALTMQPPMTAREIRAFNQYPRLEFDRIVGPAALHHIHAAMVPEQWRQRWHGYTDHHWQFTRHDFRAESYAIQNRCYQYSGTVDVFTLHHWTTGTIHESYGDTVMEDSPRELVRHLPFWFAAHGRVLITGLGLGCCLRGALANPAVHHIDVVERDRTILRIVGEEFIDNPRVTLYHGDALQFARRNAAHYDVAWHDLWTEEGNAVLQQQHAELLVRLRPFVPLQGAWAFPKNVRDRWPFRLLGATRRQQRRSA